MLIIPSETEDVPRRGKKGIKDKTFVSPFERESWDDWVTRGLKTLNDSDLKTN